MVILTVIGYMVLLWNAEGWGADWNLLGRLLSLMNLLLILCTKPFVNNLK